MAEEEVIRSSSIWRGKYFTDQRATEENFKRIVHGARIIHLASHAIIDDENPMYSKLVFSPGKDTIEDGLLHTYELYNMDLHAELACLSACNTGFGRIKSGEGVVSLARGFIYAGVPNVLMSLWSVPDNSTSQIMTDFYGFLKKGMGKAEALRQAKLKYLETADENTSAPYYWAAFTLVGDNKPISADAKFRWYWILILSILLIGSWLIYKRYFSD
jgi:CHAT domain-containing protein